MKKLLIIGQIPKEYGGNYTTGVANVILELGHQLSKELSVYIYGTNLNARIQSPIENIHFLGYSHKLILRLFFYHMLTRPLGVIKECWLYSTRYGLPPLKYLAYRLLIEFYIKKIKPDYINAHGMIFTPIMKHLKLENKVLFSFHGFMYDDPASILANKKRGIDMYKLYKNGSCLVNKSIYLTDDMRNKGSNNLDIQQKDSFIIPNGVSTDKFYYAPEYRKSIRNKFNIEKDSLVFISVGALTRRKNHIGFIEFLERNKVKSHYWIIGEAIGQEKETILLLKKAVKDSIFVQVNIFNYVPHDTGKDISSVEFFILGDQQILWQSGILKKGQSREVNVDLKGIELLALYVSDGGDGYFRDYADFANPRIITNGVVEPYIPEKPICEIYTPKASEIPRINGPGIIGIRPGSPMNYRIPVSGQRPFRYQVRNLPDGLTFHFDKGIIKGVLRETGTYTIGIAVENDLGISERNVDIVVGEKIALTPPMGWNSWNVWGSSVTGDNILNAANAILKYGLNDYGWMYVIVDDGWQKSRANEDKSLQPNEKFEDLTQIADALHEEGLKFGIYSTPWISSFAGFCGSSSETPQGIWQKEIHGNRSYTKLGQYHFEKEDVAQFAAWGVDYLKYDWNPIDTVSLARIGKEIKKAQRDILLSISNSGTLEDVTEYIKWSELWRTTADLRDNWDHGYKNGKNAQGIMDVLRYHTKWQEFNQPGGWNDPDMLVLGKVGWGSPRENRLSCPEQYTHFTLWAIWSAPLILGCNLDELDEFTLSLLKNPEVIEINQDRLGIQAELVWEENGISIFRKPLYDGSWAIAVINRGLYQDKVIDRFNWGPSEKSEINVSLTDIGLPKQYRVRDLWRREDLGKREGRIILRIPHHGVSLLKLTEFD